MAQHGISFHDEEHSQEAVEDEQTQYRDSLSCRIPIIRSLDIQTSKKDHGHTHAEGTPEHQRSATNSLNNEDGDDANLNDV